MVNLDAAARAEIEGLRKERPQLAPSDVVEQARSPNSSLHRFFTWDDTEAARQFRLHQAQGVIRAVVRDVPHERRRAPVRAVVMARATPSASAAVAAAVVPPALSVEDFRRDVRALAERYKHIRALQPAVLKILTIANAITAEPLVPTVIRSVSNEEAVPASAEDIAEWGSRNGVLVSALPPEGRLAAVNAERARHGVPLFRVVAARGPHEPLPRVNLVAAE